MQQVVKSWFFFYHESKNYPRRFTELKNMTSAEKRVLYNNFCYFKNTVVMELLVKCLVKNIWTVKIYISVELLILPFILEWWDGFLSLPKITEKK